MIYVRAQWGRRLMFVQLEPSASATDASETFSDSDATTLLGAVGFIRALLSWKVLN